MIMSLIIGGLAGFLAGKAFKGEGYGLIWDIILGLAGGLVGGLVFGLLNIHTGGLIGQLITAFVGACILVWIARVIPK